MKFSILPYNRSSASAKLLRKTLRDLGHTCDFLTQSSPRMQRLLSVDETLRNHNFIVWGNHPLAAGVHTSESLRSSNRFFGFGDGTFLTNKKHFFRTFGGDTPVSGFIPEYWTERSRAVEAISTLQSDRSGTAYPLLVERQLLNSTNGAGILFLKAGEAPSGNGKLWTEYVPKTHEYRVHVLGSRIILFQRKHIQSSSIAHLEEANRVAAFTLRNFDNGWRYSRASEGEVPSTVIRAAQLFIQSCSTLEAGSVSDLYALDIVYNDRSGEAYILEANRAPGLSEVIAGVYADALIAQGVAE